MPPPTTATPVSSWQPGPERRGKPPHSGLRGTTAGICLTLAVLATVPALLARWVRTDIVSAGGFADNSVALLREPAVRDQIVELIADDAMETIDTRRPQVRSMIVAAVDSAVQDEQFEDLWREAVAATHDTVMASMLGRDRGRARVVGGDRVVVELDGVFDDLRRTLRRNGIAVDRGDIPTHYEVELADLPDESDRGAIDDVLSGVDSAGVWLPAGVAILLVGGMVAAVNRWRAALITGIGLLVAGGLLLATLSGVRGPLADEMAVDGTLNEAGVESVVDVFTGSLDTMTRWVMALGALGIVVGTAGLVIRSRRS